MRNFATTLITLTAMVAAQTKAMSIHEEFGETADHSTQQLVDATDTS